MHRAGEAYINTVSCLTSCFCWIFSECLLYSLKWELFQMYWCGDVRNQFANKRHCMSKMVKHWIVLPCKCAVWRSVLLIEEIRVSGENQRPVASHWQTLSHNVVSSTTRLSDIRTYIYQKVDFYSYVEILYHINSSVPTYYTQTAYNVLNIIYSWK